MKIVALDTAAAVGQVYPPRPKAAQT